MPINIIPHLLCICMVIKVIGDEKFDHTIHVLL